MRFYKVVGESRESVVHTRFTTSKDGAARERKELNQLCNVPRDKITTTEVDVTPTKDGICEALNAHC